MKGYIDENGKDRPPCRKCKYEHKLTVEAPCYSCIDNVDWLCNMCSAYKKLKEGGEE